MLTVVWWANERGGAQLIGLRVRMSGNEIQGG